MKYTYLLLLLFLFSISLNVNGQDAMSFDANNLKFLDELADFMNKSRKKEGRDFIEYEFGPAYLSETFVTSRKIKVQKFVHLMHEKKFRAYPDFENYLTAVIASSKANVSDEEFNDWNDMIVKFIKDKRKKKHLGGFLQNSRNFFDDKVFHSSTAVSWKAEDAVYKFVFDSLPKIEFSSLNLKCLAKGDSSLITNTKGIYYPTMKKWIGDGGKTTWERADFDPLTTYAEFGPYEIRLKGSTYSIENVSFHNEFFDYPLMGKLSEKLLANKTGEKASYPRFESYEQRLLIEEIFPHITYLGGFTMSGSKLAGTGTIEEPAEIYISRDGQDFFSSRSLEFTIRPDKISSRHASIKIRLDNDSITHPDVQVNYDEKPRILSLLKDEEGLSNGPYFDSYHNIDMYFEYMSWKIDDPLIELGSVKGSTQHYAAFESKDYYRKIRYDALMGLAFDHPLSQLREYATSIDSREFNSRDYAFFLRTSSEQLQVEMMDLAAKGYIEYDIETFDIKIKQKLYDTMSRNAGHMDYDVLQWNSDVKHGNNAQLNLLNNNLLMRGIRKIHLSDSQSVTIFPSNGEVIMKQNRDFRFGGRIKAGNFEFLGKEYLFKYDLFEIDLSQVDSCRIYVEDENSQEDQYGNKDKLRIKNVLEDIAGTLKIDAPTNKSGVHSQKYPEYPIFDCVKNTYVYYDNSHIQGGVYDRDRFYYQLEPFRIDSLDNFNKHDVKFEGTLVSAGIFPDINEPLRLMDDLSMGFERSTATTGLPLYGGKANFVSDITLNYQGLQGGGEIEYLTTKAASDNFVFFPDSTKGRTRSYENSERIGGNEVPKTTAAAVDLAYFPTKDMLNATSVDSAGISFFRNEAFLTGTSSLTPQGMTGSGTMAFNGAELDSRAFEYEARKIVADTSDFRLAQEETENLAFKTDLVSSVIDFEERTGFFKSIGGETKIEFPANQYICFMDEFKWFMDNDEMELSSSRKPASDFVIDTEDGREASNFYSVHELQDSLNFLAPKAIYDIKKSIIECNQVTYITVADSKISPNSGKVVLHKRAKMDPLTNATILANYITKYHTIFNATVDIEGRFVYTGEGDYTYIDKNKAEQIIHIDEIKVDSAQTVGNGSIPEELDFMLSPAYSFQGKFNLSAGVEPLTFDGGTKIMHNCAEIQQNWFKFTAEIDPLDIYIPVDTNLRDIEMNKLGVGVIIADDSPIELYSTFLSAKHQRADSELINAIGFLHFDEKKKVYAIGSKEKIQQPDFPGNLVEFDVERCELSGDGKIDLNVDFGLMKINNYGTIDNRTADSSTHIAGTTIIDFFFDDGALDYLVEQFAKFPLLPVVDITKTQYEKSIKEIMGVEKSDKVISELNLTGMFRKVPQELQHTLYFADVKYKWNDESDSYVSNGDLGFATIGKKQIFRYTRGKIEVEKGRSKDKIRMYFEFDPQTWYYFEYSSSTTVMNVVSSDKAFLTIIQEVKDDKRRLKENKKVFSYQVLASKKRRNDFIDRFPEFD